MRILVVEDQHDFAEVLRKTLEADTFAVDVAEDGERASFLARTNDYSLIVLDNLLPKKNGLEVCQEIRHSGKTMPILVISVQSDPTTKVELLNAGADDYLGKPFTLAELQARVRALLRRPTQLQGDVLQVDDLTLDTRKKTVRRAKKQIYLSRKEFALLAYLMRNLGVALSRDMIMEHVWDMNVDPFSNTIESHINSLRRKICFPPNRKLIHTVPGWDIGSVRTNREAPTGRPPLRKNTSETAYHLQAAERRLSCCRFGKGTTFTIRFNLGEASLDRAA